MNEHSTRMSDLKNNDISNSVRMNALESTEVFQAIIIGAGPSGAYAARRLRNRFPGGRLLVLEKTDRVGGRLLSGYELSNQKGKSPIYDELGGMRIFIKLMSNVQDAVKDTDCSLVHVPLDSDADNIFYYKGVRHVKKDFRINGKEVPSLLKSAIERFVEETGHTGDYHESELVSSLSAREFMSMFGLTNDEIEALLAYGGYDAVNENFHAAVVLDDEAFYTGGDLSKQHYFVEEGYSTVIKRLVSRSNVELKLNSPVSNIQKKIDGSLLVTYEENGSQKDASAKMVFLCVAGEAISQLIPDFVSIDRRNVLDQLSCISLFKCFLHWDDPENGEVQWWHQLGYTKGKHTTDLPLRMVWNYDSNDLLIYNSGLTAVSWNEMLEKHGILFVAQTMFEQLKVLFGDDNIPPPNYDKTLYHYWPDGVAAWLPGTRVPDSINLLSDGKKDGSEFYVCGDANSRLQGWVSGAFDSVDCALEAAGI